MNGRLDERPPATCRGAGRASPRGLLLSALLLSACGGEVDPEALAALRGSAVPPRHAAGHALYDRHCATCHGPAATGAETGPPLVHPVYRTRQHGDEAFQLAVAQGVRAHHWRFGDMPPVPELTRDDVAAVTGYVRWLQRSVGID
jgi:mono/diheme cytochrome c family protein